MGRICPRICAGASGCAGQRVVRHTGFVAFGAAVAVARERALAASGEKAGAKVAQAIDRSDAALPLMRAAAELYTAENAGLAAELLQPFIEQIARQRGEILP